MKPVVLGTCAVSLLGIGFLIGRLSASGGYMYKQIGNTDDVVRVDLRTGTKEYASEFGWATTTRLAAEVEKSLGAQNRLAAVSALMPPAPASNGQMIAPVAGMPSPLMGPPALPASSMPAR